MKAKDLRERSVDDLKELEKSLRVDTFQNRLKNFTNRLDDTSVMNKTKRELARVITLLAEKTRAGADVIPAPKKVTATPKKAVAAPKPGAKAKSVEGASSSEAGKAAKKKTAKKDEAK